MGIGGAMLASWAFEQIKPRRMVAVDMGEPQSPLLPAANPSQPGDRAAGSRSGHRLGVVVVAILIWIARQHQAHRREVGRSMRRRPPGR
jgi:hypothetical protein